MPTSLAGIFALSTVFFGSLVLIGLGLGYGLERLAWSKGRKVFDVPKKRGQLRTEIVGTLLFHVVWLPIISVVLWSDTLRFSSTWAAELVTFPACWGAFQLLYYPVHRAMHTRKLFWMHRWHHESLVTSPMTGLSMHPAEALAWAAMFLGPAFALAAMGLLGAKAWIAFLAIHWIGNVAGHANAELFPLRATRLSTLVWSNPISYHSLHHARFDGHYGFVTAIMDRTFGTEWPDWLALHTRIMDGRPLTSLREKGPSEITSSRRTRTETRS